MMAFGVADDYLGERSEWTEPARKGRITGGVLEMTIGRVLVKPNSGLVRGGHSEVFFSTEIHAKLERNASGKGEAQTSTAPAPVLFWVSNFLDRQMFSAASPSRPVPEKGI